METERKRYFFIAYYVIAPGETRPFVPVRDFVAICRRYESRFGIMALVEQHYQSPYYYNPPGATLHLTSYNELTEEAFYAFLSGMENHQLNRHVNGPETLFRMRQTK